MMTAVSANAGAARARRSSVVLPLPRKPVSTVVGRLSVGRAVHSVPIRLPRDGFTSAPAGKPAVGRGARMVAADRLARRNWLHSRACVRIMPAITAAHVPPYVGGGSAAWRLAALTQRRSADDVQLAVTGGVEAVRRRARGRGRVDRGAPRRDRLDHRPERRRQDLAAQHDQRLLPARHRLDHVRGPRHHRAPAGRRSPRWASPAPSRTSRCSAA